MRARARRSRTRTRGAPFRRERVTVDMPSRPRATLAFQDSLFEGNPLGYLSFFPPPGVGLFIHTGAPGPSYSLMSRKTFWLSTVVDKSVCNFARF
jgi:hypothetical protein